jgi:hypothetical protein
MAERPLTASDLAKQLQDLGQRFTELNSDERFVAWFLRAYLTEDEDQAVKSLCGASKDKGVDAVFIDDNARAAFVVQGKYRSGISEKSEKRSDIMSFAALALGLNETNKDAFEEHLESANPAAAKQLAAARQRVLDRGYTLGLCYVTTGNVSSANQRDARHAVSQAPGEPSIDIVDGNRVLRTLRDYLDGVAPPIATLDLEIERDPKVHVAGVFQRFDKENGIESWVFSMSGAALGDLYRKTGVRVFARNIRGFLGRKESPVNAEMEKTLKQEPDFFFYYNNGVTVLCDRAEKKSRGGQDILRVWNPQIINGQQTTRMLAGAGAGSDSSSVLVKVLQVPDLHRAGSKSFDDLVGQIVKGTNWQNKIERSDLIANDPKQVTLEREFRKRGYVYLRKRQTKREARRLHAVKGRHIIKKEVLAQAVAATVFDPVVVREGKEKLFDDSRYDTVFPSTDPIFYLPRYLLLREIGYVTRKVGSWGYMKWLAMSFAWGELEPLLRTKRAARAFIKLCDDPKGEVAIHLNWALNSLLPQIGHFYRANRGRGKRQIDPSLFFKGRRGLPKEFARFWNRRSNSGVKPFRRNLDRIRTAIEEHDE